MLRLSIIVPVYNVRYTLSRCVQSLISQNIPSDEYEIILVNDGSTDDSVLVAQHLVSESVNVKLINQENRGLSGARNTGIENASGKYIWFIDSDDYIENNCLNQMLNEADKYDVDIYAFLEKKVRNDSSYSEVHCKQTLPINTVLSGKYATLHGYSPSSSCAYFFKRAFLSDRKLKFVERITHQDVEFMTRVVATAEKVVFTDHAVYYYVYNPGSISKSKSSDKHKKYILDEINVADNISSFAQMQSDEEIKKILVSRANSIVCLLFLSFVRDQSRRVYWEDAIALAKEKGLYPIKKPLLTWKLALLAFCFNRYWLKNLFPA